MMDEEKTIEEHLREFKRIFNLVIIPAIVLFFLFFYLAPTLINFLLPYFDINQANIVALTPWENIQTRLSMALGLSLLFLFPMITISFYRFCKPVIPEKIQKKIKFFFTLSLFSAFVGVIFGVFIFSKLILKLLSTHYLLATPMWSIKSLVNFIAVSSLSFAIIMQIVWLIPSLNLIGILNIKTLKNYRMFILLGIAIISAFVTPPDVFSQLLMIIPFYGAFELGMVLCKKQAEAV